MLKEKHKVFWKIKGLGKVLAEEPRRLSGRERL